MEKDCDTCKHMGFIEEMPLDPVCNFRKPNGELGDAIICARQKTWRSWEPRDLKLIEKEQKIRDIFITEKKGNDMKELPSQMMDVIFGVAKDVKEKFNVDTFVFQKDRNRKKPTEIIDINNFNSKRKD